MEIVNKLSGMAIENTLSTLFAAADMANSDGQAPGDSLNGAEQSRRSNPIDQASVDLLFLGNPARRARPATDLARVDHPSALTALSEFKSKAKARVAQAHPTASERIRTRVNPS
jgi:hypothetical protein